MSYYAEKIERLEAENAHLRAEVERLRNLGIKLESKIDPLLAQVERLEKAGDAMASRLMDGGVILSGHLLAEDWFKSKWNAAKQGGQP